MALVDDAATLRVSSAELRAVKAVEVLAAADTLPLAKRELMGEPARVLAAPATVDELPDCASEATALCTSLTARLSLICELTDSLC